MWMKNIILQENNQKRTQYEPQPLAHMGNPIMLSDLSCLTDDGGL